MEGFPLVWVSAEQQVILLQPGEQAQVVLNVHPPQPPEARAGRYRLRCAPPAPLIRLAAMRRPSISPLPPTKSKVGLASCWKPCSTRRFPANSSPSRWCWSIRDWLRHLPVGAIRLARGLGRQPDPCVAPGCRRADHRLPGDPAAALADARAGRTPFTILVPARQRPIKASASTARSP